MYLGVSSTVPSHEVGVFVRAMVINRLVRMPASLSYDLVSCSVWAGAQTSLVFIDAVFGSMHASGDDVN